MEYLSIKEIANIWDISKRRIQVLCREGRIEGARMIGNMWVVPKNTARPADARTKNPLIESEEKFYEPHSVLEKTYCSTVRSDLKKLLRSMYKRSNRIGIPKEEEKIYVLSILAGSLCLIYIKKIQNKEKIYQQIYKDILGKELPYVVDQDMVLMTNEFIINHRGDDEIENAVSWAYQYSNKLATTSDYSRTQFFTEKYMIKFLVGSMKELDRADKILDPCSGGGNFLVECLEILCDSHFCNDIRENVIVQSRKLYGYDIDGIIARIAIVNLRIKALSIMSKHGKQASFDVWDQIMPKIYCPIEKDVLTGSLAKDNRMVRNVLTGELEEHNIALGNSNIIVTNPPFASVKGMSAEQKAFLKESYPLANCDTCVAFMEAVGELLNSDGVCGIVSQNAWMHLQSFSKARERFVTNYEFQYIVDLGSGAFFDLSGEKSNVSLLIFNKKHPKEGHNIVIQNLSMDKLSDKIDKLEKGQDAFEISQEKLNGVNGFMLSMQDSIKLDRKSNLFYGSVAVPMQGTSTGNSKELVGYFWEHFGDQEWIPVSNGGGYCRWEGLNSSVVKWGTEGEYIKAQKGSALRNVKYFDSTQLVFSDTGTAGLNVRVLLDNQIFIASGPGIRILNGNKYAHMAFLNSRLAADYIRTISPKLTIAAGYIGRIPIIESIFSSAVLERNARLCVELKCNYLKERPNNFEYVGGHHDKTGLNIDEKAWELLKNDLSNELLKLEIESRCDDYIICEYGLNDKEKVALTEKTGACAFDIKANRSIDVSKFDKYAAKLINDACMLKRSRISKGSLGCDGILEFASKDLHINPANLIEQICQSPFLMKDTLAKYKDLIIHNTILDLLGYSVVSGVRMGKINTSDIINRLEGIYGRDENIAKWLQLRFNDLHAGIFMGKPFLCFEDGDIKQYGR